MKAFLDFLAFDGVVADDFGVVLKVGYELDEGVDVFGLVGFEEDVYGLHVVEVFEVLDELRVPFKVVVVYYFGGG